MKLSFSLSSKVKPSSSSSKPNLKPSQTFNEEEDTKDEREIKPHFVTEFDASKTLINEPSRKLVIPTKPNEWRPTKKMRNLDLPIKSSIDDPDILFELEAPSNIGCTDSGTSYGLNIRTKDGYGGGNIGGDTITNANDDFPSQAKNFDKDLCLRRLKQDMKTLPDDRGTDEFADVPVEDFGSAILAGMGWSEGKGVGRNAKEDVKIKQYERRSGMEGLGFVPAIPELRQRRVNVDPHHAPLKMNGHDQRDRETRNREDRRKHDKRGREEGRSGQSGIHREQKRGTPISWLTNQIRVRVISKNFKGGKFYRKKGKIVDVVDPTRCNISVDESGDLLQGVDQDILETALPKRGGQVLVLYGKHKGVLGNLVEKNMEEETAVIQDEDSHTLLKVRLEQIAEYIAD